ncbi:ACT domain-containing protein ACR3 isoform X3 [Physcomitrium patens]|uniref:ACT domain-containing protein ACR3 isoform X3 n=1 Tax=Physcomitrium patens TaxID=3218 RepID=UPI000D15584A|nr:ACT domain-containing protein ACR3-like isoform X3 [Physcomitrium patens]|eukprot:XP_024368430.1 ACT domain-containing protein ACR3-like isoform X3 [Physcomitrella patens]
MQTWEFVNMLASPMSLSNAPTMTSSRSWPYFDPEYDTMSSIIDPPKVMIDNDSEKNATLVKVSSQNKHGTLLEVVQELMDMDLTISKAYITSDGGWFMDVFHVTDQKGLKIRDEKLIGNIQKALSLQKKKWTAEFQKCPGRSVGTQTISEHTAIELTGTDRPGLLSEVTAVLAEMSCRVNAAEVWTHNRRVACVMYVTDEDTLGPIENVRKLERILEKLNPIMQGCDDEKVARSVVAESFTHVERRLHQLMLADHDSDPSVSQSQISSRKQKNPNITVEIGSEKNYSVVKVQCLDRPKLLFDTVCTLTDLKYVVSHATIYPSGSYAVQEYHIRSMDGRTLDDPAKAKVKRCLEAAIERRSSEGLRLYLCTTDRPGLLTEVTRTFRENGLSVTRAEVSTQGDKAVNTFYVTDVNGLPVDLKKVEAIRKENPFLEVHAVPAASEGARVLDASPFSKFIKSSERLLQGLGWRV